MRRVDVVVVGAGPAGAAAAIELAKAKKSVLLVDKAQFPRDKCCGDGLTTGALRRLEALGLDPEKISSWKWVNAIRLVTPHKTQRRFVLPEGPGHFAAVVPRLDLDAALVELARSAGVQVWEGASVVGLKLERDQATVTVEATSRPAESLPTDDTGHQLVQGEQAERGESDGCEPQPVVAEAAAANMIVADYVIAADGVWSTIRRLCEGPLATQVVEVTGRKEFPKRKPYLGDWHGYRQYASNVKAVSVSGDDGSNDDFWIWFERDLLPGYMWSFPVVGDRANVGFGIQRDDKRPTKEMKTLWPDLLRRSHIAKVLGPDVTMDGAPKAWPIPANIGSASLAEGRVLFVGDAARASDILTGEGIGQALQTGMAAANAILDGPFGSPTIVGAHYSDALLAQLKPDHYISTWLVSLMANKWICESAIRLCGATHWTRSNFARWLFEDYPRGIALTPTKWRWGLMNGPGAYAMIADPQPTPGADAERIRADARAQRRSRATLMRLTSRPLSLMTRAPTTLANSVAAKALRNPAELARRATSTAGGWFSTSAKNPTEKHEKPKKP